MPWVLGPNCKHAGSWSTMRLLRTVCVYKRSAATRSAFVFTACRIVEKKSLECGMWHKVLTRCLG